MELRITSGMEVFTLSSTIFIGSNKQEKKVMSHFHQAAFHSGDFHAYFIYGSYTCLINCLRGRAKQYPFC